MAADQCRWVSFARALPMIHLFSSMQWPLAALIRLVCLGYKNTKRPRLTRQFRDCHAFPLTSRTCFIGRCAMSMLCVCVIDHTESDNAPCMAHAPTPAGSFAAFTASVRWCASIAEEDEEALVCVALCRKSAQRNCKESDMRGQRCGCWCRAR